LKKKNFQFPLLGSRLGSSADKHGEGKLSIPFIGFYYRR